jgi:hypothetical protein
MIEFPPVSQHKENDLLGFVQLTSPYYEEEAWMLYGVMYDLERGNIEYRLHREKSGGVSVFRTIVGYRWNPFE